MLQLVIDGVNAWIVYYYYPDAAAMMLTTSLKLGYVTPALFGHVTFKIISGVYAVFPPSTVPVILMV